MTYLLVPTLMIYYAYSTQTVVSLAVVIFLLLFSLAVYMLIFRFIRQLGRESELKQIELQNKLLIEAVQSSEEIERQARHHHRMVMEYAKTGDTQAIVNYLSEYEQREEEKSARRLCVNRTVNNILRSYLRKAKQNGITVTTQIEMGEDTAISEIDLVAILGNMLDNAINGCMAAEGERSIEVSIHRQGIKLVLQCKNTCAENIHFENGIPRRTDRGGVGVSSIQMAAAQYQGDTVFSAENGGFTAMVLLNDKR